MRALHTASQVSSPQCKKVADKLPPRGKTQQVQTGYRPSFSNVQIWSKCGAIHVDIHTNIDNNKLQDGMTFRQ